MTASSASTSPRWQGAIDWRAVAARRQFAYLKASGGDRGLYTDPTYAGHAAATAGLLPVAPTTSSGSATAPPNRPVPRRHRRLRRPRAATARRLRTPTERDPHADLGADRVRGPAPPAALLPVAWPHRAPVACAIYTGASMAGLVPGDYDRFDLHHAAYMNGAYPNPTAATGPQPGGRPAGEPARFVIAPWGTWSLWRFAGEDGRAPASRAAATRTSRPSNGSPAPPEHPTSPEEDDMPRYTEWSADDKEAFLGDVLRAVSGWSTAENQDFTHEPDGRKYLTLSDLASKFDVLQVGVNVVALVTKAVVQGPGRRRRPRRAEARQPPRRRGSRQAARLPGAPWWSSLTPATCWRTPVRHPRRRCRVGGVHGAGWLIVHSNARTRQEMRDAVGAIRDDLRDHMGEEERLRSEDQAAHTRVPHRDADRASYHPRRRAGRALPSSIPPCSASLPAIPKSGDPDDVRPQPHRPGGGRRHRHRADHRRMDRPPSSSSSASSPSSARPASSASSPAAPDQPTPPPGAPRSLVAQLPTAAAAAIATLLASTRSRVSQVADRSRPRRPGPAPGATPRRSTS